MASDFVALVESIGDDAITVGLMYGAAQAKWEAGEALESLRLAERTIETARGDPKMGDLVIGSPLASATTLRGAGKMFLGRTGGGTTSRAESRWPGRLIRQHASWRRFINSVGR